MSDKSLPSTEEQWVRDDEKVKSFDGKTLHIPGKGVFLMQVRETNSKGEKRPGYVQVLLEPYDLNAAMSITKETQP